MTIVTYTLQDPSGKNTLGNGVITLEEDKNVNLTFIPAGEWKPSLNSNSTYTETPFSGKLVNVELNDNITELQFATSSDVSLGRLSLIDTENNSYSGVLIAGND